MTLVLLVTLAFLFYRKRSFCTVLLLGAVIAIGEVTTLFYKKHMNVTLPEGWIELETLVADEPVDKGDNLRIDLLITSGNLVGRTVRVFLHRDTISKVKKSIVVGEGLRIYARLRQPRNFRQSNFDYETYLKGRGIIGVAYIPAHCWEKTRPNVSQLSVFARARIAALSLRHRLTLSYKQFGLSGQAFAVVAAMSLGDKSAVSEDIRDAYSITGASHILALSGMHLGIIYSLLSFLSFGRRFREVRELLLITAIWAYVFMVGMSPSVVRSAVMLTVYSFVSLSGRHRMSLNTLAFTATVMLFFNPLCLYDIGFELSFLSVAFILVYNGRLSGLISSDYQQRHPFLRTIWQMACMSTVAQLGTSPLVVYYFGRLSVYFLLANFLVIPAATVILYASVAMLAFGFMQTLQLAVAYLLQVVVTVLNGSLLFLSRLPGASVENISANKLQVALSYIVVLIVLHVVTMFIPRFQRET